MRGRCQFCGSEDLTVCEIQKVQERLLQSSHGTLGEPGMSESKTDTLGDALPREMTRVRKLIPHYRSVPMGFLAANMMERTLDEAQRALAEGDTVAMIRIYRDLKEYEV